MFDHESHIPDDAVHRQEQSPFHCLARATFGVLNTLLYFPSGAVYPAYGFPKWMRMLSSVDPLTYAVEAFKGLLLKNTPLTAVAGDLVFLFLFTAVVLSLSTALFRRTL